MTADSATIRVAEPEDRDSIVALLDENDLPHRDLQPDAVNLFVAVEGGDIVGAGGIEPYAPNALVRSLVVADSMRGRGYGESLCDTLEAYARANHVDTLYLLTTSAARFFKALDYEVVDRERAPRAIQQTSQFAAVCPTSATCLRKSLRE